MVLLNNIRVHYITKLHYSRLFYLSLVDYFILCHYYLFSIVFLLFSFYFRFRSPISFTFTFQILFDLVLHLLFYLVFLSFLAKCVAGGLEFGRRPELFQEHHALCDGMLQCFQLSRSLVWNEMKWNEIYSFFKKKINIAKLIYQQINKFTTISSNKWQESTKKFLNYLIFMIRKKK